MKGPTSGFSTSGLSRILLGVGGWVESRNTLRIESRPDLFLRPVLGRSHKQRSKSGLTLEFDDAVRKPFGIARKPLSIELDTTSRRNRSAAPSCPARGCVAALNGPNGLHLNFLTINV